VVRAHHPDAIACTLYLGDEALPLESQGKGLFAVVLKGRSLPLAYQLEFGFPNDATWRREDPYRFAPTLGETDTYLFNEGTHRKLWNVLGARVMNHEGSQGTAFSVWAPNAKRVSLVGDFNQWDGRLLPMRSLGASGVWELFVPGLGEGTLYKFEIKSQSGELRTKTDPYAQRMQQPPETASVVAVSKHKWADSVWLERRAERDVRRQPMAIYEVHLGSWVHVEDSPKRSLSYREAAPRLVQHVKNLGFTHIELLPLAEHAFYPSWGYQVTGYFAPTARYGSPDDMRFFIDYCHRHGIGVIMDWVPAHFPKDDYSLARFDGTALYEHHDAQLAEHPDWGTLIFNFGRAEVKNFLVANALYWLAEFVGDGLRVVAVATRV
jgi:1,4-alpha-glucan branching enzyme